MKKRNATMWNCGEIYLLRFAFAITWLTLVSTSALALQLTDQIQSPVVIKGTYGKQPAIYRIFLDTQGVKPTRTKLDGLRVEVDTKVDTGANLQLSGTITRGSYEPSVQNISFEGSLSVAEDFEYSKGRVTSRLALGETVGVAVKKNVFQGATFSGDTTLEFEFESAGDDLVLGGLLTDGKGRFNQDGAFDIDATLPLASPFVYTKDPVTATLTGGGSGGGSVYAVIRAGEFIGAEFINVESVLDLQDQSGQPSLKLGGKVSGKLKDAFIFGFDGNLDMPLEYKGLKFVPGPVEIRIKGGNRQPVLTGMLADGTLASIHLRPLYPELMSANVEMEEVQILGAPLITGAVEIEVERPTEGNRAAYRITPEHLETAFLRFRIGNGPENDDIRRWFKDVTTPVQIGSRDLTINYTDIAMKRYRVVTLINARPKVTFPDNVTDSLYFEFQYTGLKISN